MSSHVEKPTLGQNFDPAKADALADAKFRSCLANVTLRHSTAPHFAFPGLLLDEHYALLSRNWPCEGLFKSLNASSLIKSSRAEFENKYSSMQVNDDPTELLANVREAEGRNFWIWYLNWLSAPEFANALLDRLRNEGGDVSKAVQTHLAAGEIKTEVIFQEDRFGATLPVHRDSDRKIVSLIYYVAMPSDSRDFGTRVFQPKDLAIAAARSGRIRFSGYNPFEWFDETFAAPYLPNSGFVFLNHPRFWHGVRRIDEPDARRRVVIWNLVVA
jgi:hypothetical protein